jgi:hypothetical protein
MIRAWLLVLAFISQIAPSYAQQAVVGFESGPSSVVGTPANSSHAAGTVVGPSASINSGRLTPFTNTAQVGTNQSGLFVIPVMRLANLSAIITQVAITSSGGSTGAYVVRIWRKLPSNTTCVDGSAFAGNFATDDADLITLPFSVTPAAPASTTGDAGTYAPLTVQTFDAQNTDSPGTRNLYVCLQTIATDTADDNNPIRVMVSGPQN